MRYFALSNAVVEVHECCGSFCFIFHTERIFVLVKAIIHDILETNLNGLLPSYLCVDLRLLTQHRYRSVSLLPAETTIRRSHTHSTQLGSCFVYIAV